LVNVDNTISGVGSVGAGGLSVINGGTIRGDGAHALVIDPQGATGFTNEGRLEAVDRGGVVLRSGPFTTSGQVLITLGSSITRQGDYVQTAGSTIVDGILDVTDLIDIQGGVLGGGGTIIGDVQNNGQTSPGSSPGLLNIAGDYTQTAAATLLVDLEGDTPGQDYDVLDVSGTATLAGALEAVLAGAFMPADGQTFDVLVAETISGTFNSFVPPTRPDLVWDIDYLLDPIADDVVRLSVTVVPEPATLSLLALGGLVVLRRRRR
jgi:hypothetical protein